MRKARLAEVICDEEMRHACKAAGLTALSRGQAVHSLAQEISEAEKVETRLIRRTKPEHALTLAFNWLESKTLIRHEKGRGATPGPRGARTGGLPAGTTTQCDSVLESRTV